MEIASIIISVVALIISGWAFWVSNIKLGTIKMTKPTVIFFGPDGQGNLHNKVFVRTLLYSTSERGQYVENMYINLHKDGNVKTFNVWIYEDDKLVRGSGLHITKAGLAGNHHFLLQKNGDSFDFIKGEYLLEIFVQLVNQTPKKIFQHTLRLSDVETNQMKQKNCGIYFDWEPNNQIYQTHIDERAVERKKMNDLFELFAEEKPVEKPAAPPIN